MSEVLATAWDRGYEAGRADALGSLRAGAPISRENPYRAPTCPQCGCDIRFPSAAHVLDCKEAGQ